MSERSKFHEAVSSEAKALADCRARAKAAERDAAILGKYRDELEDKLAAAEREREEWRLEARAEHARAVDERDRAEAAERELEGRQELEDWATGEIERLEATIAAVREGMETHLAEAEQTLASGRGAGNYPLRHDAKAALQAHIAFIREVLAILDGEGPILDYGDEVSPVPESDRCTCPKLPKDATGGTDARVGHNPACPVREHKPGPLHG